MRAQGKNLYAMGISHITSSPDIIGACGMRGGECRKFEEVFIALGCSEALILSTCNRVELYVVGENIPLEKIVLETDSPYLTPAPYRGKKNSSKYIPFIAEKIAFCKNVSVDFVAEVTTKNTKRTFHLD